MALYFVGLSDNDLIYLDPHYVHESIPSYRVKNLQLEPYIC